MGQVIGTSVASQTLKAARIGDSDSIYKLVQADRTRALRAADQGSGFTALHYACRYGHTAVVWVLLQEDAPTEVVCKVLYQLLLPLKLFILFTILPTLHMIHEGAMHPA